MEKWIGIPYLKKEIENLKKGWTSLDYDSALVDVLCIIKKYEQKVEA
jgi:hypothetical protein